MTGMTSMTSMTASARPPRWMLLSLLLAAACASAPPAPEDPEPAPAVPVAAAPKPKPPDAGASADAAPVRPGFDPNKGLETTHLTEKAWLQAVKDKLSAKLKIEPDALRFSAAKQWAAFVRSPPAEPSPKQPPRRPRKPKPRRHEIFVVDMEGRPHARFRPVTARGSDEPPKDLRFLSEDKLVYEVVSPPPEAEPVKPPPRRKPRGRVRVKAPPKPPAPDLWTGLTRRLFVVQPFVPPRGHKARAIRCEGVHFEFTSKKDHLAYVTGKPDAAYVAVDGEQVYPRKGRTQIASELAWSRDGQSLAFLEARPAGPARLVLLAQFDNATGDVTWNLPDTAKLDGARVFWAGARKLVVGKTAMRPVFATSFEKESPKEFSP
jgi:hypothetical protein